jgi:murein DD-endopeptidase MepM/ murein hydrolase activator NlpD
MVRHDAFHRSAADAAGDAGRRREGLESHYYAHLDRFGTFREGDVVEPGDVLGYVGTSGNARGTPSHLHYGIYRGRALNPYSRLAAP